jgi:two-component SAPR family response regulator
MKTVKFEYRKTSGEVSNRHVMILHEDKNLVEGIDFRYLDEKEYQQAVEAQMQYEEKMKPLLDKAFRRFSKSNMIIEQKQ